MPSMPEAIGQHVHYVQHAPTQHEQAKLPMYMYQALLAALLPSIVVADGEYLVSLFVKYFSTTMQYVNCKPPH